MNVERKAATLRRIDESDLTRFWTQTLARLTSLDRHMLNQKASHLGVGFVSLTEALDLTTPIGRAMAGLLGESRAPESSNHAVSTFRQRDCG